MNGMMVLFHCESNPGYAASSHEHTFLEVAKHFTGDISRVHYAYANLDDGLTPSLPPSLTNVIQLNTQNSDPKYLENLQTYIKHHRITRLLGFDQPVSRPAYKSLRAGGINTFVSYWGAPMSSVNQGIKLLIKKMEVSARRHGPDHYIFQSEGMRSTAIYGRGIPSSKTSVVKTGIDIKKYSPDSRKRNYAYECFNIPKDRHIVIFSGHMERRKGVHIILEAASHLVLTKNIQNLHFLILGNRPGEKENFNIYLKDPRVSQYITFGGYRADVHDLLKSCSIGIIASTEWDSFPMSSLEMAATGLPIVVSDLPGLNEAVTDDTGLKFSVGDPISAANSLAGLINDPSKMAKMGANARARVIEHYSRSSQAKGLIQVFEMLERKSGIAM